MSSGLLLTPPEEVRSHWRGFPRRARGHLKGTQSTTQGRGLHQSAVALYLNQTKRLWWRSRSSCRVTQTIDKEPGLKFCKMAVGPQWSPEQP